VNGGIVKMLASQLIAFWVACCLHATHGSFRAAGPNKIQEIAETLKHTDVAAFRRGFMVDKIHKKVEKTKEVVVQATKEVVQAKKEERRSDKEEHVDLHEKAESEEHKNIFKEAEDKRNKQWQASLVHDGAMRFLAANPKKGKNVTIACMYIGREAQSLVSAQKNHIAFAKIHGYNYFAPFSNHNFLYGDFSREKRHPTWNKMAIIQYLFDQGSDAVFWTDADSLFMSGEDDLAKFMGYNKDMVFSGDGNVIFNAGHFLLRRSEWSQQFLRRSYAVCPAPHLWMDNSAMLVILAGGHPDKPQSWDDKLASTRRPCISKWDAYLCSYWVDKELRSHVEVLEQEAMNSYRTAQNLANMKSSKMPFIAHRVDSGIEQRKRELQHLASVARYQIDETNGKVILKKQEFGRASIQKEMKKSAGDEKDGQDSTSGKVDSEGSDYDSGDVEEMAYEKHEADASASDNPPGESRDERRAMEEEERVSRDERRAMDDALEDTYDDWDALHDKFEEMRGKRSFLHHSQSESWDKYSRMC
jgi:hypothetical protein